MNLITNGWKSQVTLRYGKLVYFATTTKKHCHCQFYIFSKLGHEIFNCHSFDSFLLIFAFLLYKVDCSIPRLSDSVLLIGAALRLCQQLKDKVHNDIVIVKGRLPR